MKDDLNPEFLAFSEMLDREESLDLENLDSDGQLLLELRRQLRDESGSGRKLPPDFAKSTAAAVTSRIQSQSALVRILLRWDTFLRVRVLSGRGLLSGLLLLGSAYGLFLTSPQLLLGLAVLTLLGSLTLRRAYAKFLPDVFELRHRRSLPEVRLPAVYYLLPLLAAFGTAALSGRTVASLGDVSLSVRASGAPVEIAGIATAGVVWLWLMYALVPLWKAATQRAWSALLTVWISGFWIWGLTWMALGKNYVHSLSTGYALLCAVISVAVYLSPVLPAEPGLWAKCLRRCFSSLFIGLVPVLLTALVSYQLILTREIRPDLLPVYESVLKEFSDWEQQQREVTPSENGFEELKPFFLRSRIDDRSDLATYRRNQDVVRRLKDGSDLWRDNRPSKTSPENLKELDATRESFLRELPRIRRAVDKPSFTYLEGPMSYSTEVPNYVLCRAISQGLAGLVDESLQKGETDQALDYLELGLRWSAKVREGNLISLMIGVAQNRIATTDLERFVFEGHPTEPQLQSLARVLEEVDLKPTGFRGAMMRDVVLADRFLQDLVVTDDIVDLVGTMNESIGFGILAVVLPRSFWESERKAHLNLMLGYQKEWTDLAKPGEENLDEILAMNPAAQMVVPNTARAQTQYTCVLSRMAALKTVVALERYKKKTGKYPDKLAQLVPEFLTELPVDAMQPKRWSHKGTFEYHKTGTAYELISSSPLYSKINFSPRQSYGPDGDFDVATLKK